MDLLQRRGKSVQLGHRAFYCGAAAGDPLTVVVGSQDGHISRCDFSGEPRVTAVRAPARTKSLSVHPTSGLLAVIDEGSGDLLLLARTGAEAGRISAPTEYVPVSDWAERGYNASRFDPDGAHLWCASHLSEKAISIEVRRIGDWAVVARGVLEDSYGDSSLSFYATPDSNRTALWVAAGQDGQSIFWAQRTDAAVQCTKEALLENSTPPAFSPSGREFLILSETGELKRLSYPAVHVMGSLSSLHGEDAPFDTYGCYLDDRHALVRFGEGRLALVDMADMSFLDELAIEGHEPRPVEHYHPRLAGDQTPCTDIQYFFEAGELICFVFRIDGGVGPKGWRDGILSFTRQSLIDELRLHDRR